jgi:hypothetical protein
VGGQQKQGQGVKKKQGGWSKNKVRRFKKQWSKKHGGGSKKQGRFYDHLSQ